MKKILLPLMILSSISQQAFAADRAELCSSIKQLLISSQSVLKISVLDVKLATGSAKREATTIMQVEQRALNENIMLPHLHGCISQVKLQDASLRDHHQAIADASMQTLGTVNEDIRRAERLLLDVDYTIAIMK